MKVVRLKESDIQRIVKRTLTEDVKDISPYYREIKKLISETFPLWLETDIQIPFKFIYYNIREGKTAEEIFNEYINSTPTQIYEKEMLLKNQERDRIKSLFP